MATSVLCDKYGFFNGIMGLEQSNWANYWKGVIPDGVLLGYGDDGSGHTNMVVYAGSYGMLVKVAPGQALVDNHRVWVNDTKELEIEAAGTKPRKDLVVARVAYGNDGESVARLVVKKGTEANTMDDASAPSVTRTTGGTYEIPLAEVQVAANAQTIASDKVTDKRYLHRLTKINSAVGFKTAAAAAVCVCEPDYEYRYSTGQCDSLTIYLPESVTTSIWMTSVNFTASNSFTGVAFKKYRNTGALLGTAITPKIAGDALTLTGRRYNLVIWNDGAGWWVASKAV